MAMTEQARHELHEVLRTKLGRSPATTLMEALPPVGWADVATKQDLVLLRGEIEQLELRLELRFEALLERRISDLHRSLLFALLTSQATLVGLVFAAVKLG